jgi:Tfp pilus assembly protein PilO
MSPADVESAVFFWRAATFLVLVLGIAGTITSLIVSVRRKPALPEELYRDYATKAELYQLRTEFLKTTGEVFDVMRQLKNQMDPFIAQVNRLEGALSRCPGPADCHKENGRRP